MLNKIEKQIMRYFYNRCYNKESCLIRPEDIKISLIPDIEINDVQLDRAVNNLIYDDSMRICSIYSLYVLG